MSYLKLSPDAAPSTFFKADKSVVQSRLWLPKGMHEATVNLHDDGTLKVTAIELTDSKNAGKFIYLMNCTVHVIDSDGNKNDVVGDVAIDSEIALADAQKAVKEQTSVTIVVTHNMEKGACYCTLASEEQVKIKMAADLMEKLAAKKAAEAENATQPA